MLIQTTFQKELEPPQEVNLSHTVSLFPMITPVRFFQGFWGNRAIKPLTYHYIVATPGRAWCSLTVWRGWKAIRSLCTIRKMPCLLRRRCVSTTKLCLLRLSGVSWLLSGVWVGCTLLRVRTLVITGCQ